MDRLMDMIKAQFKLQQAMGFDPFKMTDEERIAYIKDQTLGIENEIHEMLGEIGWKAWATSRHINRDAAFGELRDAWQCLINLMLAVTQWSPDVLAPALERELYRKHTINYDRIESKYDGVNTKCPRCKRALDEPGAQCMPEIDYCVTA